MAPCILMFIFIVCSPLYNIKSLEARLCIIFISWLHMPYREECENLGMNERLEWFIGKNLSVRISLLLVTLTLHITHFFLICSFPPPAIERDCFNTNNCLQSFLVTFPPPRFTKNSYWFSNQKSWIHWCNCKGKQEEQYEIHSLPKSSLPFAVLVPRWFSYI